VREFLVKVLSAVGTETSLGVLRAFADDPDLGVPALEAIAAIQRRLATAVA